MSELGEKLILSELKETRQDIKDLHSKIDGNYKELTNKIHTVDKTSSISKLKLTGIMSFLSIFWAGLIKYITEK